MAGVGNSGKDRDKIDGLERDLTHDLGHRHADDEHVRGGEHPDEDGVLATPHHEQRTGCDGAPLHPPRLSTGLDLGDTAHHLEQQDSADCEAEADQPVTPAD